MVEVMRGYAEGYYGRLFSWEDRLSILDSLQANAQTVYYYAPKEDPLHRWQWRSPYPAAWRHSFSGFCAAAAERGIQVVAGVAPGLDFDFAHLNTGSDFAHLLDKCRQLLADGANHLSLLLDDIDANFVSRSGAFSSEGEAHAQLANSLADELACPVWVTPRIYANELAITEPRYLPDFLQTLDRQHVLLYCGTDVVARHADPADVEKVAGAVAHSLVLWDNLYANDYCPRRLFLGPWLGRERANQALLNPTGLLHTDRLLLDIMACESQALAPSTSITQAWLAVLSRHEVPDAFLEVAHYFRFPVFNNSPVEPLPEATNLTYEAIEECLWCWKTPLSREWYSCLYGLKHDLLIGAGQLPELRIQKTQNAPLSYRLSR